MGAWERPGGGCGYESHLSASPPSSNRPHGLLSSPVFCDISAAAASSAGSAPGGGFVDKDDDVDDDPPVGRVGRAGRGGRRQWTVRGRRVAQGNETNGRAFEAGAGAPACLIHDLL